jgi:hypothetical protein
MPRKYIVLLVLFCIALNAAGFLWNLFEPVPLYDEIAHFITPFTLVLIPNAPPDTIFDTDLGVLGGAAGACVGEKAGTVRIWAG